MEVLDLADSYISLSVHAENDAGSASLPATTLMASSGPRRIVLVGDPGTTDDGHFAFAHRALHEYLAAAQLARDPRLGCDFLLDRWRDAEWRQVAVLFCGENHAGVEYFLRRLSTVSPELACQCLATADVAAEVAGELISRARRLSMLSPIMEAVKSPVAATALSAHPESSRSGVG